MTVWCVVRWQAMQHRVFTPMTVAEVVTAIEAPERTSLFPTLAPGPGPLAERDHVFQVALQALVGRDRASGAESVAERHGVVCGHASGTHSVEIPALVPEEAAASAMCLDPEQEGAASAASGTCEVSLSHALLPLVSAYAAPRPCPAENRGILYRCAVRAAWDVGWGLALRGRVVGAGAAVEAGADPEQLHRLDRPGSSLRRLALSQCN
eukprot:1484380-Rhodomonas_salina.4